MTVRLLPSPDKISSDKKIADQQYKLDAESIPPTFTTTKLGSFAWFCLQYPDFLKFIFQCILSSFVLGFCVLQLANGGRDGLGKNDALYWGGITSILAWWMPSPGGSTPRNQANVVEGDLNVKNTVTSGAPPSGTDGGATSK
ncbi:MAG: hypothetical protein U7123_09425 [Potamolinea sp.]